MIGFFCLYKLSCYTFNKEANSHGALHRAKEEQKKKKKKLKKSPLKMKKTLMKKKKEE